MTIVAVESVTAGLFASTLAFVQGASGILKGGIVTYNEDMKNALLDVKERTLKEHTAESMETTREMVVGLRNAYGLRIYISVTGVASPSTPEYPLKARLEQIIVCCWINGTVHEFEKVFESEVRNEIRQRAVEFMME